MATFTTIAAAGVTAAGAGMSFAQAAKQSKLQKEAEAAADKYVAEAKRQAELNPFDALAIQKEPYELAREASLQSAANIAQGAREGDQRGVAATAGAIQGQLQGQQAQIRSQMGQDLMGLEQLSASQDVINAATLSNISLEEAKGKHIQAAQAEEMSNAAMQSGIGAIQNLAMQGMDLAALYKKNKPAKMTEDIMAGIQSGSVNINDVATALGKTPDEISAMNQFQIQDALLGSDELLLRKIIDDVYLNPVKSKTGGINALPDINPFQTF